MPDDLAVHDAVPGSLQGPVDVRGGVSVGDAVQGDVVFKVPTRRLLFQDTGGLLNLTQSTALMSTT